MPTLFGGGSDLLNWLSDLEAKTDALPLLGLPLAWKALVQEKKSPLSVSFTQQRYLELAKNFDYKLTVLFGKPITHSLSPALHNYFNLGSPSRLGLYLLTQVKDESQFLQILRLWKSLPLAGANVTSPFKECAFNYLNEYGQLTPEAQTIGAVNTIYYRKGELWGDNTDWSGWLSSWHNYIGEELEGRRVVIFGAGGAARAVVYALIRARVKSITVVNSPQRGQKLADYFNSWQRRKGLGQRLVPVQNCQIWNENGKSEWVYIQATVLGSSAFLNLTPYNWTPGGNSMKSVTDDKTEHSPIACDLIYNPAQTEFLRLAKQNGAKTMNGLGMLICQAYQSRAKFFDLELSEKEEARFLHNFSMYVK